MKTYENVHEIARHNREKGHYFFEKGAMNFFNSKIESDVIKGRYFITSEISSCDKKRYSVRLCLNGKIETIGKFHSFDFYADAESFINELPEQLPFALNDAINAYNGGDDNERNEFITHALIEPCNNTDSSFSIDSYCGACTYIIRNYDKLDMPYIKYYEELYNERMIEE